MNKGLENKNQGGSPGIRFNGYTDAWEQRKLGDILERRIEQRQQSEKYPRLAFASGQGVIPLSERKTNNREQLTKDEFSKKYLVTELDDIVYNPANVKYGAIDRNKCGRGLISPIYVTFTTKEIPGFIERIVTSHDFKQRALRFEEGTVTKRQSVNPEDLITLDVLVAPQRDEQKKISSFFDDIDSLITLHQRKYDELKELKKYMLQNMFPKKGSNKPVIRFKGFTDTWEQRKLSELTTMHARIGWQNLRTSEFLDSGDYMLITGTDFNDGSIDYSTCHYVEKERYDQDKNIQIHNGSILITKDGTLGKVAYVQGLTMPATLNAGVFNVEIKDESIADEKYLFQYLKAPFLMDYVSKKATGGTIKHLNQSILVDFPVAMPEKEEQAKIGEYFQSLDNLITLHQRKLDELKELKKYMLQNMFPNTRKK